MAEGQRQQQSETDADRTGKLYGFIHSDIAAFNVEDRKAAIVASRKHGLGLKSLHKLQDMQRNGVVPATIRIRAPKVHTTVPAVTALLHADTAQVIRTAELALHQAVINRFAEAVTALENNAKAAEAKVIAELDRYITEHLVPDFTADDEAMAQIAAAKKQYVKHLSTVLSRFRYEPNTRFDFGYLQPPAPESDEVVIELLDAEALEAANALATATTAAATAAAAEIPTATGLAIDSDAALAAPALTQDELTGFSQLEIVEDTATILPIAMLGLPQRTDLRGRRSTAYKAMHAAAAAAADAVNAAAGQQLQGPQQQQQPAKRQRTGPGEIALAAASPAAATASAAATAAASASATATATAAVTGDALQVASSDIPTAVTAASGPEPSTLELAALLMQFSKQNAEQRMQVVQSLLNSEQQAVQGTPNSSQLQPRATNAPPANQQQQGANCASAPNQQQQLSTRDSNQRMPAGNGRPPYVTPQQNNKPQQRRLSAASSNIGPIRHGQQQTQDRSHSDVPNGYRSRQGHPYRPVTDRQQRSQPQQFDQRWQQWQGTAKAVGTNQWKEPAVTGTGRTN